jgi:hypothetical protein
MALVRMALAEAHRAKGNEPRAVMELRAAGTIFDRIGAVHQGRRAAGSEVVAGPVPTVAPDLSAFRREGDYWSITFDACTVRVRDLKGMHYLARLLADPGREFHVLDLVALETGTAAPADNPQEPELQRSQLGDAGEMLDARAKEAYRRRLAEIDEDIEEARAMRDDARASQAQAEREFLVRELSRAVGLGGRDRRAASASERARASVTRAVRQAITRIRSHHPSLANHLDRTLRTGAYCAYLPDPRAPMRWTF